METVSGDKGTSNTFESSGLAELLELAGYRVRGHRADCIHCDGHSRLTLAFNDEVAFCHRCKWTRNVRTLSREMGLRVAPETPEQKLKRARDREFREWVSTLETTLSDELVRLSMIASYAKKALAFNPNNETAWEELRRFYDDEPYLASALDFLAGEKVSRWIDEPMTREKFSKLSTKHVLGSQ